MAKNLGKIRLDKVIIKDRPYGLPFAGDSDIPWKDHAEAKEGCIYLVVDENGLIIGAGPDPAWNLLAGYDVWEVSGEDYEAAIGKTWDGSRIV